MISIYQKIRMSLVVVAYLLVSIFLNGLVQKPGLINPRYGVVVMTRFEANNPFARRVLVPLLTNAAHSVLPESLKQKIETRLGGIADEGDIRKHHDSYKPGRFEAMRGYWSIVAVAFGFNILMLFCFFLALRRFIGALYAPPPLAEDWLPLSAILFLPLYWGYSVFVYDYAALFLFTLGLSLLAERKMLWFYILLPIALLNKEPAVLLPLVFAATFFGKNDARKYTRHLILQGAICAVVLGTLVFIFRNNPGRVAEWHLARNIAFATDISTYFQFAAIGPCPLFPRGLPFIWPLGPNVIFWLPVLGLIALGWKKAPRFLKKMLPTIIIPLALLIFFLGYIDEIRASLEALPVIIALALSPFMKMRAVGTESVDIGR